MTRKQSTYATESTIDQKKLALDAERTLLSWIRTSLAAIVAGLGIIRFFIFKNPVSKVLVHGAGQLLLLWGIIVLILAFRDYRYVIMQLARLHARSFNRLLILLIPLCLVGILLFFVTIFD